MHLFTRQLAASLLASFTLLLAACGGPSPEALIQRARDDLSRHDAAAAVISLKTLLQQAPESAEARYLLGQAFLDSGDPRSAETELRKALDLNYSREAAVPALARAMVLQGQFQKLTTELAGNELTGAAAKADLSTSLAVAYARQGQRRQAEAALQAALAAAPKDGRARVLQARFKAEAGDVDGAMALLDELLREDAQQYEAWQLKGDLSYLARRDSEAALEAHRKALAIRGDLTGSHASILSILLARRDLDAARDQLAALKRIAPNQPETLYIDAELALLAGDVKRARELAQELLRRAPDNVRVLQLAGAAEYRGGSMLQAVALLSKAVRIAPHGPTQRLLAQAYLRSGDADKALETVASLLRAAKPDAATLALAAQAHLLKGDPRSAENYFERAAKLDPGDAGSRTALALGQLSRGKTDLGFQQLEEIAASDKTTVADLALLSSHLRRGNFEAALKALDGYERKDPNSAMAAHQRGMIQLARKDVDDARRHFERALSIDPTYFPAVLGLVAMDLAQKKPEQARKRFDAVLAVDPKNVRALMAIVDLRASAGASADELKGLLSNAVRLNPSELEPRLRLIDAHMKADANAMALSAAQEGVAARPDSPELLAALGRVQAASGEIGQAIASFNRLAEMQPRSPEPSLRLAELHLASGNAEAARQSYQRALSLAPRLLPAQRGLIMLEASAGRTKEALALARTLQADPARAAVGWLYAGDIEAARKNWGPAIAAYRASLKAEDTAETAIKLHTALLAARQPAEADRMIAEWSSRHPGNPAMLVHTGNLAIGRQDFAEAEKIYLQILQLRPDDPLALNNLAVILGRLNKPGALAYAEKANTLKPGQPIFMDTWAMLLAEAGKVKEAIELEKKALALQPGNASVRLNLARLYIKAGQKSLAKTELEELAKLGDRFAAQGEVAKLLEGM